MEKQAGTLFSKSYKWMQLGSLKWYSEMIWYSRTQIGDGWTVSNKMVEFLLNERLTQHGIYQIWAMALVEVGLVWPYEWVHLPFHFKMCKFNAMATTVAPKQPENISKII